MSNVIQFPREFRKRLDEQMDTVFGKPETQKAFERVHDALTAYYLRQIKDRNNGGPSNAA